MGRFQLFQLPVMLYVLCCFYLMYDFVNPNSSYLFLLAERGVGQNDMRKKNTVLNKPCFFCDFSLRNFCKKESDPLDFLFFVIYVI